MPPDAAPSMGNCFGQEIDPSVDFGDDLVERRVRRQRVADQRDIDAMRHHALGHDGKKFLGTHLPIAAMDEQERRRALGRLEEVDAVALAIAISEVE